MDARLTALIKLRDAAREELQFCKDQKSWVQWANTAAQLDRQIGEFTYAQALGFAVSK